MSGAPMDGSMHRPAPVHERYVCDLDSVIDAAMRAVRGRTRKKDLLIGRTSGNDGMFIDADPHAVLRAVTALLLKAIHRSPYRGVITLDVSAKSEHIEIHITDQQPGSDPRSRGEDRIVRSALFQP